MSHIRTAREMYGVQGMSDQRADEDPPPEGGHGHHPPTADQDQLPSMRGHAIFAMDQDGFVTSWNDRAEDINGFTGDEIIGRHCSVLYPRERVAAHYPEWELSQAARAGLYMDQSWRVRNDGSRFWASVAITAQRSNDGGLVGFIALTRDDTEARARHQRSTRRFTDLFDLAPVGIGLFDESDRILHANGALCELLGYRLEELHGTAGVKLLHPDDNEGAVVPTPPAPDSPGNGSLGRQRVLARSDGEPVTCNVHSAVSMEDSGARFWQVVFQDVTEEHRRAAELHHQATHDELTGLPNRSGIHEHLEGELGVRAEGQIAVLFCDLDNFKRINDSLGHEAGDELLVALARRLKSGLPDSCTVGRLFGDEFLVVCSNLDTAGGLEQLATNVSELMDTPLVVREQTVWLTASIGAAVVERADTTSHDLVRFADAAMFEAKARSPGGIEKASEEVIVSTNRQVQAEGELREAIGNDRLTLHYQPIVAEDGTITMAEALLRWSHPELGLVGPSVILSVAEQGNLLRELDRSVLRMALREAATWPLVRGRPIRIAVNFGGLLPDDPYFAEIVSRIIAESGIDRERVVLEVVETSLSDLPDRGREDMVELARGGVRFAIDDFGTAYSSLKRLKELPVQLIKIDRGFVTGTEDDPADLAIVRAIVDMARGLDCGCVAEGVETVPQLRRLVDLGVDTFQGFLFSHPQTATAFRSMLASSGAVPLPES
ncbi:putative bifunctional diguanylate cyclase/phosphodiesterase [Actinopolyspora halophila]|uniref:putative bifunctional diguanylate cyclase/phosphodiesterase n=1 Tax=Actinopolyspora halophila TaxID=1850 RepID=UPI0003A4A57E|nr:bifunctional diguanylate cyclase/phosphodiesterase [Actinopolyspora halophila]